jgi:hypothetical protein
MLAMMLAVLTVLQQSGGACNGLTYANANQAEPPALRVDIVRGIATESTLGSPVPAVCVGVFSEEGHVLVAATISDSKGRFRITPVKPGLYRLVASAPGFVVANNRVRISGSSRTVKSLRLHLVPRGTGLVSYFAMGPQEP